MPLRLDPPLLPDAIGEAIRRASTLRHPVWLVGGSGSGAPALARRLAPGGERWLLVSVRRTLSSGGELESRLSAAIDRDPAADGVLLYVERVDRQPPDVQEAVLRAADEGLGARGRVLPVRLVAQSERPPDRGALLPPLALRLAPYAVFLPSLDSRRQEMPAIVAAVAATVAEDLGLPAGLGEEARAALAARDWPGGLDELEAAVATALRGAPVQAAAPGAVAVPPGAAAARPGDLDSADPRGLEFLLTELAHELKNPMVTIKTFAQHLDHLLGNDELREKFVRLTTEAIDRMDGFVEELLAFSRFAAPRPQSLPLGEALTRAVAENGVRQRIAASRVATKARVRCDEEQLVFLVQSLVRGLSRELPEDARISLEASADGEVVLRSPSRDLQRFRKVLDDPQDDDLRRSIEFVMADALLRRNGGSSEVVHGEDDVSVRIRLPLAEAVR